MGRAGVSLVYTKVLNLGPRSEPLSFLLSEVSPATFTTTTQAALYLRLVAVSGRQHPLAGDEGATAEVVAGVQRHLVGNRVPGTLIPTNDPLILGSD